MDIQKLIKEKRLKLSLTQEDVAKKLFISRNAYSHYETGKRKIDSETFLKITELLNINIEEEKKKEKNRKQKDIFEKYFQLMEKKSETTNLASTNIKVVDVKFENLGNDHASPYEITISLCFDNKNFYDFIIIKRNKERWVLWDVWNRKMENFCPYCGIKTMKIKSRCFPLCNKTKELFDCIKDNEMVESILKKYDCLEPISQEELND